MSGALAAGASARRKHDATTGRRKLPPPSRRVAIAFSQELLQPITSLRSLSHFYTALFVMSLLALLASYNFIASIMATCTRRNTGARNESDTHSICPCIVSKIHPPQCSCYAFGSSLFPSRSYSSGTMFTSSTSSVQPNTFMNAL